MSVTPPPLIRLAILTDSRRPDETVHVGVRPRLHDRAGALNLLHPRSYSSDPGDAPFLQALIEAVFAQCVEATTLKIKGRGVIVTNERRQPQPDDVRDTVISVLTAAGHTVELYSSEGVRLRTISPPAPDDADD